MTKPSMKISDAAATGDRRATLEAMRAKLAADMDDAPASVVAQIAGRLAAILAELEMLPVAGRATTLSELETRRKNRLAEADESKPAKRQTRQHRARSG